MTFTEFAANHAAVSPSKGHYTCSPFALVAPVW